MRMFDRYDLDDAAKVRYTEDGYLVATPRVARTGIQLYYGSELGLTGDDAKKIKKVYRPEDEVFKADSMHSFAHKPFTDDHPPVAVQATNWKDYARGQAGEDVVRDGEFIRVPMVLMDSGVIKKFQDGKAELSVGYDCEIDFSPGTTPSGMAYDARQKNIKANHIAVVDAARGGDKLRIGDGKLSLTVFNDCLKAIKDGKVDKTGAVPTTNNEYPFVLTDGSVSLAGLRASKADAIAKGNGDILAAVDSMLLLIEGSSNAVADSKQETLTMKVITIDGVPCQVDNDQTAAVIQRALDTSATALKAAQDAFGKTAEELAAEKKKAAGDSAKAATEIATKDAEIATLKKQLDDSKLTPAKLDQLVKDRAVVAGKARAILGDKLVVDGKTDTEIMTQVVSSKMGDTSKDWNADQIKISFDTLTAGTKPVDQSSSGVLDTARAFSAPSFQGDARAEADKVHAARDARLSAAWKTPAAQA